MATAGVMTYRGSRAEIEPSGVWTSDSPSLAERLNDTFKPRSTTVGTPWIMAFHDAAGCLGAQILIEPESDSTEGTIH